MSEAAAIRWLDAHTQHALTALEAFCAIPSVSTDPAYATGMSDAAAFLAAHLRRIGLQNVAIRPTAGHPVVTADWLHAPGAQTILVYGHYDVQPPDPLEKWISPPFTLTERDGNLYARGASDDKGPLLAAVTAIAAWLSTDALPVNVRLLIEGEEEIGSAHLDDFVAAHAGELKADFVLSADGAMWSASIPSITVASRGLCALEVTVTGAGRDLHSGRYGGLVANPIQALAALLAGLHGDNGSIAVPGFLDDVRPISDDVRAALAEIPFHAALETAGEAGFTPLERNWFRPTLEFNGIFGGYAGPGSKTVIPGQAGAKISCRLVPDQDPARMLDLIEQDLMRRCPPGVRLQITRGDSLSRPYRIAQDHPGIELAKHVLRDLRGSAPLLVHMGATIPIGRIFRDRLGIDTVFFSFATADEDYHAPNEFFRLRSFHDGMRAWIRYIWLLAQS